MTRNRTLHVCINSDGDVTADMDKALAIERMEERFGGDYYTVEMELEISRPSGYLASIIKTPLSIPLEEALAGPIKVRHQP